MDFQSAARFGERRVMVTDYDETAVEVNAKVVDEDTGEVICECKSGGGGGESDFAIANVTVQGEDVQELTAPSIISPEKGAPVEASATNTLLVVGSPYKVILYKGHCLVRFSGSGVSIVSGSAAINGDILDITGDCTLNISKI